MVISYRIGLRLTTCLLALALLVGGQLAHAMENVTLQLRWRHQFQFAGYYAALHKGFYREAGLDVTIREGGVPGIAAIDEVLSGRAQFGISNSGLVKTYLDGKPVLLLAAIGQHSPTVLLSLDQKLTTPSRLAHAGAIGILPGDESLELKGLFANEGIPLDKVAIDSDHQNLDDLLAGKVVAVNAYTTNEPFILQQRGIPFTLLKPDRYGMDFYSDVLFTTRAVAKQRPEVVAAFRAASLKGWEYALQQPDEIIDLILAHYNTQGKGRQHLAFEAKVLTELISPDLIQIGHSNPWRWRHIANAFAHFGMVPADPDLDGFFYNPNPQLDLTRLYVAIALLGMVSAVALYILRINRRLGHALRDLEKAEAGQRQLLSVASHEFRTPAAMIKTSLDSLGFLKAQITPDVAGWLDNIRYATTRLIDLANTLITQDRLLDQSLKPNKESVELCQLLTGVLAAYPPEYRLVSHLPTRAVNIAADPALLRVALHNLIDNAFSHNTSPDDPVVVTLDVDSERSEIRVADSGPGISDTQKQKIFERFYSAKGEVAKGIGLFIVRTVARSHGGDAFALDNTPKGAVLVFDLPIKRA